MRAYSQDLRDRVISKYNTGEYQIKQLASIYQMSRQTIGEWVKRYKATGIMGLAALYPKKKKNISLQNKSHEVYKYLLDPYWKTSNGNRSIDVPMVNEVWSGDITYMCARHGVRVGG